MIVNLSASIFIILTSGLIFKNTALDCYDCGGQPNKKFWKCEKVDCNHNCIIEYNDVGVPETQVFRSCGLCPDWIRDEYDYYLPNCSDCNDNLCNYGSTVFTKYPRLIPFLLEFIIYSADHILQLF